MKILFVLLCFVLALSQTPPTFPPQYTLYFDETAKLITTGTTKGVIYFDAPSGRQVIER